MSAGMLLGQADIEAITEAVKTALVDTLHPEVVRAIKNYSANGGRFRYPLLPSGEYALEWGIYHDHMTLQIQRYDGMVMWATKMGYGE